MKRFLTVVLASTFLLSGCNTSNTEIENQDFSYIYSTGTNLNGEDKIYINNFDETSNDLEKVELENKVNVFEDAYSVNNSVLLEGYKFNISEPEKEISSNLYKIADRKKNKLTGLNKYVMDEFKYKEKVYLKGETVDINSEVLIVDDKKIDTVDIPIFAENFIGAGDILYIIGKDRKTRKIIPMNINNNKLGKPINLDFSEDKLPDTIRKENFFSLGEDIYYRVCLPYSVSKNKDKNVFYKKLNKKTNKFEDFDFKKEGFNIESYVLEDFRAWDIVKSYEEKTYILMENTIKVIDGKNKKVFEKEISRKVYDNIFDIKNDKVYTLSGNEKKDSFDLEILEIDLNNFEEKVFIKDEIKTTNGRKVKKIRLLI